MSDYISRKAAVKIAQKYGLANGSALGRHTGLADCIAIEIEGLPAADVAPVVHGRWGKKQGGFWEFANCSVCGQKTPTVGIPPNYCPSCGSKMDLEGEIDDRKSETQID